MGNKFSAKELFLPFLTSPTSTSLTSTSSYLNSFISYSIFSGKGIIKSDHKGLQLVAPDIAEDIISVNFLWDVRGPKCGVDLGVSFSSCMHSNESLIRQEQRGHCLPHFILILRCKKKPTSKISPL